MTFIYDFDQEFELVSEELLEKSLSLAEKFVKDFRDLPIGKKLRLEHNIKKASDLIIVGLAIKFAKADLKKYGKSFRIHNTQKGWIIEITPRTRTNNILERTEDIMHVLQEIAKAWTRIRTEVGEWIEMYVDIVPRYVIDRFLRIFEHLDLLIVMLKKISKIK